MKKIILSLCFLVSGSVFADIKPEKVNHKNTVCLDGIRYFVGVSFDGQFGIQNQFVASVKIDPKTMQPEKCN